MLVKTPKTTKTKTTIPQPTKISAVTIRLEPINVAPITPSPIIVTDKKTKPMIWLSVGWKYSIKDIFNILCEF